MIIEFNHDINKVHMSVCCRYMYKYMIYLTVSMHFLYAQHNWYHVAVSAHVLARQDTDLRIRIQDIRPMLNITNHSPLSVLL